MKNNWKEELEALDFIEVDYGDYSLSGDYNPVLAYPPSAEVDWEILIAFISRVEQEAYERGRREALGECVEKVTSLLKLRFYEDSLDQVKAGAYNKAIDDVLHALKPKLTPKE